MITRSVDVLVTDQNGIPYENAIIVAVLDQADLDPASGYVVPEQKTFRTDGVGSATMELWPNERGNAGSRYRVTITTTTGDTLLDVWATVPDIDGENLEDISSPVECSGLECTVPGKGVESAATEVAQHEAKPDPHPQYATGGAKDSHSPRIDNPHGVTAAQVGADEAGSAAVAELAANNYTDQQIAQELSGHISDTNPHPSYATGGVHDSHSPRTDNPHGVTALQVGADPAGSAATAEQNAKQQGESYTDSAVAAHKADSNPHPEYETGGARDSHSPRIDNPHGVTAAQTGADPAGSAATAEQNANAHADQVVANHESASNPHSQYVLSSEKNQPSGVAGLDSSGLIAPSILPDSVKGDVVAPASPSLDSVPVFVGGSSKALKETSVSIDEHGNVIGGGKQFVEFSGVSLVLDTSHKGKCIWCTNSTQPVEIYAPDDSTLALSPGYEVTIIQGGNSSVTIKTLGGDNLISSIAPVVTTRKGSGATLFKKESGVWWARIGGAEGADAVIQHEQHANPHPAYILALRTPIVINGDTTLNISHLGRQLRVTGGAVLTLPEDATSSLPEGFWCEIQRRTTSNVTFAVEGTDVLESEGNGNAIANDNGWASVMKMEEGVWALAGSLKVAT